VNLVPTELNQRLSSAIRYSVVADRFYISGRAGFWRFIGIGMLAFGFGAAVGIAFYGYAQITRNSSNINLLSSAFSSALSEAHLKATSDGTVHIEPHEIALAKGQTISIDMNSRVGLDPKATVLAQGEITVPMPTVSVPQGAAGKSATGVPIITNFTVFKSLPYDKGDVLTGWKFLTSAQQFPTTQYCYYTEKSETSPLEPVVYIGVDEKLAPPKQVPKGFDVDAAFKKCVWFAKGAP
jgi:hypothetical protein